jgi:hypothetical protein
LKSLRDLGEVQRNLKTETGRLVDIVKAAEVFALALKGAAREMEFAAKRLEERFTDGETIERETAAKIRFEDLVSALEPGKNKASDEKPESNGGEGGPTNAGPQTDGIPHLAQLKMLKTLQEDLIRRTEDLDRVRRETGNLTDDQRQEVDLLAGEQGLLADLTRNLTAQFADAFQPEPEEPFNPDAPEKKPEPEKTPGKRPSLEDQLNRDLELDNLLPKPENKSEKTKTQAGRSRSEWNPLGWHAQTNGMGVATNANHALRASGLATLTGTSLAFAYPAQTELKKTAADEPEPKAPPKAQPGKPKTGRDEELLRGLVGKDPLATDATKNPLEEAIQGMRSAQERIQGKDTGKETREIQEDVVANLQKLIDLAKKNQNKPPSPQSGSPKSPQNPAQAQPRNVEPMSKPEVP